MIIEYHLFRTKPLEKCFFDCEEVSAPEGISEVLHVVDGLKDRILKESKKAGLPVQGYAFLDKVPAVLIRSSSQQQQQQQQHWEQQEQHWVPQEQHWVPPYCCALKNDSSKFL